MKSFKAFITESPMIVPFQQEMGTDLSRSHLRKPLNALVHRGDNRGISFPRLLKPKLKGKIGEYTVHHATIQDRPIIGDPETKHYLFLAKDGNVVGSISGERIRVDTDDAGKKVEHIGISVATIDTAHRGQDLYARALKLFVQKTPHVLYSDIAQSEGAKKAWSGIAKTSDADGIDFRVHPLVTKSGDKIVVARSDDFVGSGIPKTGELNPRYWIGGPLEGGAHLPADKIRFSIRGKRSDGSPSKDSP